MQSSFCCRVSLIFLVFVTTLVNHSFQISHHDKNKNPTSKTLGNRFLVSLDSKNPKALSELKTKLDNLGVRYTIKADLTTLPDVFYGASIELEDKRHAKVLGALDGIENIKSVDFVTRGITYNKNILSRPLTSTVDKFPPHLQTRINLLHNQGIYGKGIKVALIDSGIDCGHPAFGAFGKGRLAFGRSYVNDAGDRTMEGKVVDPCATCARHGTHTAGIVGAADVGYGFQGVAPNVTLGMYRVFNCDGNGSDDLVLAALLQAHQDGADIITASLGQPGGWGEGSPVLDAVNRLVETKGSIIFFSAGNSGSDGLFAGSSPASARSAISVGSVDSSSPMPRVFKTSTGTLVNYYRNEILPDGTFPVYLTSPDTLNENDACFPLPSKTPDLSKYAVLIKIGGCFASEKVAHAKAKGAKLIIFYSKSRVIVSMRSHVLDTTVAVMSLGAAQYIAEQVKKDPKENFRVTFSTPTDSPALTLKPGFNSPFSQYGPSFDFESPQPAVTGIGGNVVSTFPMEDGGFAFLSGTSMAAPQLAGIAALVLSHRGKKGLNGLAMRARLATSTRITRSSEDDHRPETVVHQGGGLVDGFCAVMANTIVTTTGLTLADSASFRPNHEFEVSNSGDKPVHYNLIHLPARSVQTFSNGEKYNRPDVTPDTSGKVATAIITPHLFTLAPGAKQTITVRFTAPPIHNRDLLTIYSGYIILGADVQCETHNVPYYGVVGSLKDQEVIDRGPVTGNPTFKYPYLTFQSDNPNLDGQGRLDILDGRFTWNLAENSFLYVKMRTLFGSPFWIMDIIDGRSNPKPSKQANINYERTFGGIKIIGQIPHTETASIPRTPAGRTFTPHWDGTIITSSNPTVTPLPDGEYRLLVRGLRVNGDKKVETDYDFWVSAPFQLSRSGV